MSDELSFNEDWEEWDRQDNFLHHMVAGSIAGITEHTVMYPVDTFKTYVQCMRECPEAVAGRRVMEMVRGQGLLRLWRGVGTMFTGCVPAHALYFSVLEHCKVCERGMRENRGSAIGGEEAGYLKCAPGQLIHCTWYSTAVARCWRALPQTKTSCKCIKGLYLKY